MGRNSATLEAKLRLRVLALAGIAAGDLPAKGEEIVAARVAALVSTRNSSDGAIRALAASIAKQFPKAVTLVPAEHPALPPSSKTSSTPTPVVAATSWPVPHHEQRPAATTPTPALRHTGGNRGASATDAPRSAGRLAPLSHAPQPFTSPERQSVKRKRLLAAADSMYVEGIRQEAAAHEADEARRAEARAAAREQMRRDMEDHAHRVEARKAEDREEREMRRQQVLREVDDIRLDEAIERDRRRDKFAREKDAIEQQRVARRAAKVAEEARTALENQRYRREAEQGLKEDETLTEQRAKETRDALVAYLNDSKAALEEKRRLHKAERDGANQQASGAAPLLPGGPALSAAEPASGGGGGSAARVGMSATQAGLVAARRRLQDAVSATHAAHVQERDAAAAQLEAAAMEAERRTAEEQHRRNERERAKAARMRTDLVSSLELELDIHRQRAAAEERDKHRLLLAARADVAAHARELEEQAAKHRAAQRELRVSLARQIADNEERMNAPQEVKVGGGRGPHFLSKSPVHD
jgi:hypothetical protein